MEVTSDFKTMFYNLEGVHFTERKKSFYKLLHATAPQDLVEHLDIEPQNYLEKVFYVDILIRARQTDRLLKILQEGNGVLTSRILKQKWFFEEAFQNISNDELINAFLPSLCYPLRMKVLKKLALTLSESRMDEIFDLLFQRYGIFTAKQFVFSCSSSKIIDIIRKYPISLSAEQLKRILAKDSKLVKIYLEEYKKNMNHDFHDYDFLNYLTRKYPNLYFEFAEHCHSRVKLGRYTTRSVLRLNESHVLKDLKNISSKFNTATVTRDVKDFDTKYFPQLFPKKVTDLTIYGSSNKLRNFLMKYPQKKRWIILSTAFKKAYNEDILNHLKLLDERLVFLAPEEIKFKWAELKYAEKQEQRYIKYMTFSRAFALIKDIINVTAASTVRYSWLSELIEMCHNNKDYKGYEEVLKYICTRHRNEDSSIRNQLLRTIRENLDLELATEGFWKWLNDLVEISRVKGYKSSLEYSGRHLMYLLKKNLPIDEALLQFLKDHVCYLQIYQWKLDDFNKEPCVKGKVIQLLDKHIATIEPLEKQKVFTRDLLKNLVEFNLKHKEHWVDLNECDNLTGAIRGIFAHLGKQPPTAEDALVVKFYVMYNYSKGSQKPLKICDEATLLATIKSLCSTLPEGPIRLFQALFEAAKKPRTSDFQNALLDYLYTDFFNKYSEKFPHRMSPLVHYVTQEEPDVLAKYYDNILLQEEKASVLNYSVIKMYSHLSLDQKLIAKVKPFVLPESTSSRKLRLIESLPEVMPVDDFINLIAGYIPDKPKLDLTDQAQKALYEAQCIVVKALKKYPEVTKLVPLLYKFCQGDYLQSSLPLMYKVLYFSSEREALQVLTVLVDKAVSVRKHAAYLALELEPQETALELFRTLATKEKNVSAQKYLFQAVLKFFLKNPSEDLLKLVLEKMVFIDKNDTDLFSDLVEAIKKVPKKFKPVLVENYWRFLDTMEGNVNAAGFKLNILYAIHEYEKAFYLSLDDSFCREVIERYFFSKDDSLLRNEELHHFVTKHLLSHSDDEHFKVAFQQIEDYKARNWSSNSKSLLKCLSKFFQSAYSVCGKSDEAYFSYFKAHWERVFTHQETFIEHILLQLMEIYRQNPEITEFSKQTSKKFQEFVSEYGPYINDLLFQSLKSFAENWGCADNDKTYTQCNMALQLLKADANELNSYIAVKIVAADSSVTSKQFEEILECMKGVKAFSVRVYCNELLKRLEADD